ncbi:MAG TPA: CPBP family intramembrane glutamic endopeptidase [Myxococcales bacterium]|nr:CPBP family intramembrane glutamic endopeptidase [Myxococcales bacterium]
MKKLLVGLGCAGYVCALPFLASALPARQLPIPLPAALALSFVQLALLLALAAYAGSKWTPRVALDAPFLRALAEHSPRPAGFRRAALEALAAGTVAAALAIAVVLVLRPYVPAALSQPPAAPRWLRATAMFYGGTVEEILLRWAVLPGVWLLVRRAGGGFWPANVITALIFGAAHLPSAKGMGIALTLPVLAHVVLANAVAGIVFGWMFRRRGLESAMIAHACADLWLQLL